MKASELGNKVYELTGLKISSRQLTVFLHEFNKWEMPISKRLEIIDIDKFCDFIMKNTQIPINAIRL